MSKILAIDDENTIIDNIKFVLELSDYEVITASNAEDGLVLFYNNINDIDVVITDMRMPKQSGLDVLKKIHKSYPEMSVIILTGHGDMENAIMAMKEGAFEYLRKPVNADELTISVKNAIDRKNLMLDNVRMQRRLLEQNEFLQALQNSAQKILLNLLPKKLPVIDGYNFSSEYKSCETVGGDMYDIFDIGNIVGFYVFDVSSHGILASVITVLLKSFIQNVKYNYSQGMNLKSLDQIVKDLNIELFNNTSQEVFATLFIGFIEKATQKLYYVSAGHINQMIFSDTEVKTLPSTGTVLGIFDDATYKTDMVQLKKGDRIVLFTDGIIEATRENLPFGYDGLTKVVGQSGVEPLNFLTNNVLTIVFNYAHNKLDDDVTLLAIEVL